VEPEIENPQEVPLPSTDFRALAQANTANIFDLLQPPATTLVKQLVQSNESDHTLVEQLLHPNEADAQPREVFYAPHSPQLTFWDLAA
jgi:hypothetical protein